MGGGGGRPGGGFGGGQGDFGSAFSDVFDDLFGDFMGQRGGGGGRNVVPRADADLRYNLQNHAWKKRSAGLQKSINVPDFGAM